ncbi:MAG: GAF domain-containing protein [Alphaproteobacteria bacterium]|nr:GAF domain-containing protein [Alphaproteobacteria bacterium]MBV8406609.1 GAF domain-containing protein [Alphaproteobacteria bacterium]
MTGVVQAFTAAATFDEVFVTRELNQRAASEIDHRWVKEAIQELAVHMVDGPEKVLPRFVALAMEIGRGVSSGISVAEFDEDPPQFRWAYLQGTLSAFEGATTPRDFSPCGITLDNDAPVLTRHSERYYPWIAEVNVALPEVLLVPLHRGSEKLGTLWIVSDELSHFNRGHVEAITEIAAFVSIALRIHQTEIRLSKALHEQEALAKEMSHRVKNVFAIVDGIIHFSGKRANSKDELVASLAGRVRALAVAHGIVRRSFRDLPDLTQAAELGELLHAIALPYEVDAARPRIVTEGPAVALGQHATNSVALVLHELATNAAKYGALTRDGGGVTVTWTMDGPDLILCWKEHGGPLVSGTPAVAGFGSTLVTKTIETTLGGRWYRQWLPEGLEMSIRLPLDRLRE